jgi:hypothetical protein
LNLAIADLLGKFLFTNIIPIYITHIPIFYWGSHCLSVTIVHVVDSFLYSYQWSIHNPISVRCIYHWTTVSMM